VARRAVAAAGSLSSWHRSFCAAAIRPPDRCGFPSAVRRFWPTARHPATSVEIHQTFNKISALVEKPQRAGAIDITWLQQSTPNPTLRVARGSNSTPLSDAFAVGASAALYRRDGYGENKLTGEEHDAKHGHREAPGAGLTGSDPVFKDRYDTCAGLGSDNSVERHGVTHGGVVPRDSLPRNPNGKIL
jgi:hypothetical protein